MSLSVSSYDRLYLAGRWSDADQPTVEVRNPATGEVVTRIAVATLENADAAVAAATQLHEDRTWADLSFGERADRLDAIADAIERRTEELTRIYAEDQGGLVSLAPFVIGQSVGVFRGTAKLARGMDNSPSRRSGSGSDVLIHRVPVGPVLASVPWNGPLILAAVKVATALAAGCPVIVKVDVQTPLASFLLAEAIDEVGLPPGLISVLPAEVDVAKHLVSHPGVKHVSFTGSTAVGKDVMRAAAENMTRLTLELGGKSAAIVLDDFDPASAPMLVPGCLAQTGQVCTTFSRLLVPAERFEEWKAALVHVFSSLKIGDPTDPATVVGPLVSAQQLEKTEYYVSLAREEGTIIAGGQRPDGFDGGYWYEPTLVTDVEPDSRIAREEVFGPVTVLLPFQDLDDAIRIANDSEYGLAAGIFTNDVDQAVKIAPHLTAGAVSINNFGANFLEPFGGFGASGIGREGGIEGIESFLETMQIQFPMAIGF
ncbi:aldehyde dehydrogenase (plasmid) [Rhodococcus jostii RHA1]|uniref:Aldehyde dehydrogenase n=1 Tax=Rhodococcus jostii (strain RHA1) TaxID=101510 RepID=Q0RV62_RHOJR|nr:aldehyde dehydrogenase family protein [Rhodococcus jostii]ABH00824.1 aldehyde dehydrogenase [Rhodococcus jostii RHA1]